MSKPRVVRGRTCPVCQGPKDFYAKKCIGCTDQEKAESLASSITVEHGVARVPLTKGHTAIMDAGDVALVSKHSWCAVSAGGGKTVYAARGTHDGKTILLHREILGAGSGREVDHINGNGLDNRRSNLRLCSGSQNAMNRQSGWGAHSKFKGVTWHKAGKKWRAYIKVGGKQRHLGCFDREEDAALAYDNAATEAFGDFASLNFPDAIHRILEGER